MKVKLKMKLKIKIKFKKVENNETTKLEKINNEDDLARAA